MVDEDPRAKYRELPPNIDSDDFVVEVDAETADAERRERDYNNGADPYLRITGWLPPGS